MRVTKKKKRKKHYKLHKESTSKVGAKNLKHKQNGVTKNAARIPNPPAC